MVRERSAILLDASLVTASEALCRLSYYVKTVVLGRVHFFAAEVAVYPYRSFVYQLLHVFPCFLGGNLGFRCDFFKGYSGSNVNKV